MDKQRRNWLRARFNTGDTEIRMPWLKALHDFTDLCTRCGKCISACPESIIVKGDGGFPSIDFRQGECTFCQRCAQVCPESLFVEDLNSKPWNYVANIQNTCLTQQGVMCQSCQDFCEVSAIGFQPRLGAIAQPELNSNDCTGCGACVSSCPVNAISVLLPEEKSYAVHCV